MESTTFFENCSAKVFAGDIHIPQEINSVFYIGSPYPVHFGDHFKGCGVLLQGTKAVRIFRDTLRKESIKISSLKELQKLEGENSELSDKNQPVKFVRVDSDSIDKLIPKDEDQISKLSDEDQGKLKTIVEEIVPKEKYTVQLEALDSNSNPFIITQPEFMRRMKEMQQTGGGGMMGMGNFPEMYNLVVNTNSDLMDKILKAKGKRAEYVNQALDVARLSQNLLQGKEMTEFIKRSYDLMKS